MTAAEERRQLGHILQALHDATHARWQWQPVAIEVVAWLAVFGIAVWLFATSRLDDGGQAIALIAMAVAGSVIGSVTMWRLLHRNSALVCRYIDEAKVRARLAELEAGE